MAVYITGKNKTWKLSWRGGIESISTIDWREFEQTFDALFEAQNIKVKTASEEIANIFKVFESESAEDKLARWEEEAKRASTAARCNDSSWRESLKAKNKGTWKRRDDMSMP